MENQEIKDALFAIKESVATKATEQNVELKSMIDALEAKMKSENTATINELKADLDAVQKHADILDVKLQEKSAESKGTSYNDVMVDAIAKNHAAIKNVTKGRNATMEVKVVGNMTATANLTGASVMTYQNGVALLPSQKVNVSDLVPTVNSATGNYVIYRETTSEGSISEQTTPGVAKTQIDYDYVNVTYVANYIAGYARVAKQMLQDLPFLQSALPSQLRRDYFKAENSIFYTALDAAATAAVTTKTESAERLLAAIAQVENANYDVTGIVVNPSDWAVLAITKPADYSVPQTVNFVNNMLTIGGVPVFKATWMPVTKFIVGDWNQAKKVVTDGLSVEFFEQDADNVTKNLTTVRVESRTVLAIDQPLGFCKGTFTVSI